MSFVDYATNRWLNKVPSHRLRQAAYRQLGMEIGRDVALFLDVQVLSPRGVHIGNNTIIAWSVTLDGRGGLTIGNNVNISSYAILHTASHDVQSPTFAGVEARVVVGDYAWISTRALVLPGVTIGEGAVVAAGAVVTKSVEPYTIVGGVPARPIGKRQERLEYTLSYRRPWY